MGRIMAFDYGEKRIGIAITDPSQVIASPFDTVERHKVIDFIKAYTAKEKVELFVVGYPKDLMNRDMEITPRVDEFISGLQKFFPSIAVKKVDERFTSSLASQSILQSGISKSKRRDKSLTDKVSASLILQTYLELNKR
jgi:putative holliday junction resolvase